MTAGGLVFIVLLHYLEFPWLLLPRQADSFICIYIYVYYPDVHIQVFLYVYVRGFVSVYMCLFLFQHIEAFDHFDPKPVPL